MALGISLEFWGPATRQLAVLFPEMEKPRRKLLLRGLSKHWIYNLSMMEKP